jgi:hypothetical protein
MGIGTLTIEDINKYISRSIERYGSEEPKDKDISTSSVDYFRL